MKILVAVDGSKPSLKAVQLLVDHCDWYREAPEVELLAVHLPVPRVGHLNKAQLERY
jgi:nucleotide-binding universal stress UspA family protein